MITLTIGSGGDYATLNTAYQTISAPDGTVTFTDDYTFLVISDFTENAATTNRPRFGGHTLTISNPNRFVTTFSSSAIKYSFQDRTDYAITTSKFVIDGLIIRNPYDSLSKRVFNVRPGNVDAYLEVEYKNIIIFGVGLLGENTSGISTYGTGESLIKVSNCKFYNIGYGVRHEDFGHGISSNKYVENCSMFQCKYGVGLLFTNDQRIYLKNICSHDSVTKDYYAAASAPNASLFNCADSDNSIIAGGFTISNCITGVTDSDFESVTSTSSDFLKLPRGQLSAIPAPNPEKGLSPLRVDFNSNVEYFFSSILADAGTVPSLTTTDLAGELYGKYGDYPIGCYNAELA